MPGFSVGIHGFSRHRGKSLGGPPGGGCSARNNSLEIF
jgi:hypothetical protein